MNVTSMQKGGFRRKGCPVVVFLLLSIYIHLSILLYISSLYTVSLGRAMCELSAYVAFDKATKGQIDIKHEMDFPNSIFAREGAFHRSTIFNSDIERSVFPISGFICLSVCRFVEGDVCRKKSFFGGV